MTNSNESGRGASYPAAGASDGPPVLELRDVVIGYGRITALHGISLRVDRGELVTLLGANGAGKSTTMRGISGLNKLTSGEIYFEGARIDGLSTHQRVARGIVQVPEGRHIFPGMTVLENLDMGCYGRRFESKAAYGEALDRVFELFPRLGERRKQYGGTMSGGEQQMLAIGRALMARPRLLLLDEPSMGLAPMVIKQIFSIIAEINAAGTTILLVEQNANMALNASDYGYVLENGRIAVHGPAEKLRSDPAVQAAYLGGGH